MVLTDDRIYCEQSLHRLLHSSPSNKRRWLHRMKVSRAKLAQLLPSTSYLAPQAILIIRQTTPLSTLTTMCIAITTQRLMSIAYKERSSNTRAPQLLVFSAHRRSCCVSLERRPVAQSRVDRSMVLLVDVYSVRIRSILITCGNKGKRWIEAMKCFCVANSPCASSVVMVCIIDVARNRALVF
jgi:cell division inhibitor SulA